jgi:hypothetical protein
MTVIDLFSKKSLIKRHRPGFIGFRTRRDVEVPLCEGLAFPDQIEFICRQGGRGRSNRRFVWRESGRSRRQQLRNLLFV